MPVFFEGVLKLIGKKSFTSNEGEHVEYFELYFQGVDKKGDPAVLKVNSKQDLTDWIDQRGMVELQTRDDGKPKFVSFTASRSGRGSKESTE